MDATPNFASSFLDEAPTEVNRPKPVPVGTYLATVGTWEAGKSAKKGTPFAKFKVRLSAPDDDVDLDALQEALTFGDETQDLTSVELDLTFYDTPRSAYQIDAFHEHCGIDLSEPMSRRMRNDAVLNSSIRVYIEHEQANENDPSSPVFARIRRTLPA